MLILRDPADLAGVEPSSIRHLLAQRFEDLCQGEPFEADIHGFFILVEAGDTVSAIEAGAGCPVLSGLQRDSRYGNPDFVPAFEVLEEHPCAFEFVCVPGDGDFGVVILIPKEPGIDPEVIRFCKEYAIPASSPSAY